MGSSKSATTVLKRPRFSFTGAGQVIARLLASLRSSSSGGASSANVSTVGTAVEVAGPPGVGLLLDELGLSLGGLLLLDELPLLDELLLLGELLLLDELLLALAGALELLFGMFLRDGEEGGDCC